MLRRILFHEVNYFSTRLFEFAAFSNYLFPVCIIRFYRVFCLYDVRTYVVIHPFIHSLDAETWKQG